MVVMVAAAAAARSVAVVVVRFIIDPLRENLSRRTYEPCRTARSAVRVRVRVSEGEGECGWDAKVPGSGAPDAFATLAGSSAGRDGRRSLAVVRDGLFGDVLVGLLLHGLSRVPIVVRSLRLILRVRVGKGGS